VVQPPSTDSFVALERASGFTVVIEARPGHVGHPVGLEAFAEGGLPDLQVLVDRPLGNGSVAVCDLALDRGGVPATNPPVFASPAAIADAINDLGCRVNDGTGAPRGRIEASRACTRDDLGAAAFVHEETTTQFCLPIAGDWRLATGETVVVARVRDDSGAAGEPRELRVRVTP
jgi:hypothetical protein